MHGSTACIIVHCTMKQLNRSPHQGPISLPPVFRSSNLDCVPFPFARPGLREAHDQWNVDRVTRSTTVSLSGYRSPEFAVLARYWCDSWPASSRFIFTFTFTFTLDIPGIVHCSSKERSACFRSASSHIFGPREQTNDKREGTRGGHLEILYPNTTYMSFFRHHSEIGCLRIRQFQPFCLKR